MADMAISMSPDWLSLYSEKPVDPDRPIVDPHHHLWPPGLPLTYGVDELVADTGAGHNVVRPSSSSAAPAGGDPADGAGGRPDSSRAAADLLERHPESRRSPASSPRPMFDPVRSTTCSTPTSRRATDSSASATPSLHRSPEELSIAGRSPLGSPRLSVPGRRASTRRTRLHLRLAALPPPEPGVPRRRRHAPTRRWCSTTSAPARRWQVAGRRDEIFPAWCDDMREIAACENVVVKLGGLAMPDNGFGYHRGDRHVKRRSRDQRRWYEHMIECFGPGVACSKATSQSTRCRRPTRSCGTSSRSWSPTSAT